MPRITFGTVVKLVIASLLVGLLLATFNLTPQELLFGFLERVRASIDWLVGHLGWAFSYVLLGAVVVIPIWLVAYLIGALRRGK